jgi:hypothetical protein
MAALPAAIKAATGVAGYQRRCNEEQRCALVADLWARLLLADPESAAQAVAAHEARASAQAQRNGKIAGEWELYCREDGATKYGSLTFDMSGAVKSDLTIQTAEDEIFASSSNICKHFRSLNVDSLTYATKHKIMRQYIKGELTINVIDEATIEGSLKTLADHGPDGYGDDPSRFVAEFTGRRCQRAKKKHKVFR